MKGFRTLGFNIAAAILPILQAADLTDTLDAHGMAIYGTVIALINIALRAVTDTPMFVKKF